MAINTVRVQIEGSWYNLARQSDGSWQATLTAPNKTSFNLDGGVYKLAVEAENDAGTKGSGEIALQVLEKVKPIITVVSPGSGAYVTNSKQPVVFTVTDETGGSGVNLSTLVVKLDGAEVAAVTLKSTAITGGYSVTFEPEAVMSDGAHTVQIAVSDNDGNAAEVKTVAFTVDTVPPVLTVNGPAEGLITAQATIGVRGKTNDVTSSPVSVKITLNGVAQGTVAVGSDGGFSKTVQLTEGDNTILVTATDAAGRETSITRRVKLDSSVPKIVSAVANPNPADAGATVNIVVMVE